MAAASPAKKVRLPAAEEESTETAFGLALPDILPYVLPYLSIRDCAAIKSCSKNLREAAASHTAEHLAIVKATLTSTGPSARVFETYGAGLLQLSLHRVPFADKSSFPAVLALCPNLKKLSVSDCDWTSWDDEAAAAAIASLKQLQELRLQCNDIAAERNPFQACVRIFRDLPHLRKITLFTRLDPASTDILTAFLSDAAASRRLVKVKFSTGLLAGSGGGGIITALAKHAGLQKVTIVRPDGMGEPLRKAQCTALGAMVLSNKGIVALHLRRCGMWTDTLAALVPAGICHHVQRLKLDGNSLGYLSGAYFNEAMDLLLSRMPNLTALHLGNNQLDHKQAEGLAASFTRHRLCRLENLTLGSNDIGDTGLAAILKALPPCMKQLYLHGIDCSDEGVVSLKDAIEKWPEMWGLGLNGNPITDAGAKTLARAIKNKTSLRDIGITLSEMTDIGCGRLAAALKTCRNLRYVYLYTTGFKAAQKVTDDAKRHLKEQLPLHATAAFDHRLSRYLKKP